MLQSADAGFTRYVCGILLTDIPVNLTKGNIMFEKREDLGARASTYSNSAFSVNGSYGYCLFM